MCSLSSSTSLRQQQGVTLIFCLVALLILTLLGVQAMQTSLLEERMAGSFKDRRMAFEAAEAGLQAAQLFINLKTSPPKADSSASNGIYTFGTAAVRDNGFWASIDKQNGMTGLAEGPRYAIEERGQQAGSGQARNPEIGAIGKSGAAGSTYGYRITARGVGGSTNTVVILQGDFEKVF